MLKKNVNNLEWQERFVYLKNVVFDEKTLHQSGTKFQIIRFLPGAGIGPHFHNNVCEIFYVKKGKGVFIFNNVPVEAVEDDIFLCQPKDVHEIINKGKEELMILIFKTNEDAKDITWVNPADSEKFGE